MGVFMLTVSGHLLTVTVIGYVSVWLAGRKKFPAALLTSFVTLPLASVIISVAPDVAEPEDAAE